MKITHIIFDPNSFGITQKSLKILRDALAERVNRKIAVMRVPTNDICCGYFIFDWESRSATWTGDGFRTDERGEGGAGYKSAKVLFDLFGMRVPCWGQMNFDEIYHFPEDVIEHRLKLIARNIAESISDEQFSKPSERMPEYVR